MNIVFLDRDTFSPKIRFPAERLEGCGWREYPATSAKQIVDRIQNTEIVLTNKVKLPGEILRKMPQLKLIAATATGVDNIDVEYAGKNGIAVCNVRGYAQNSVAEHVFAMLLTLRRNIVWYRKAVRRGDWTRSEVFCLQSYPMVDLAGSTLGIIGGGTLGKSVARLGGAFNMRVLMAEYREAPAVRPDRTPFDRVLRESDVISLHVPLTAQTRGVIGERELAQMKSTAILINTARGGLVDELALVDALRAGRLGGAAFDVLTQEPPPADHPLLAADIPNLLVTPHIAWASLQAQQKLADEVVTNIDAFLRGKSRNRVV
jgi:glycerate dehydrogenase